MHRMRRRGGRTSSFAFASSAERSLSMTSFACGDRSHRVFNVEKSLPAFFSPTKSRKNLRFYSAPAHAPADNTQPKEMEESFIESRLKVLREFEENRKGVLYPYYSTTEAGERSLSVREFIDKYNHLQPAQRLEDVEVEVAGRITAKRESGKKMVFYDIHSAGSSMQVMAVENKYKPSPNAEGFAYMNSLLKRGDIIVARGHPGKTKTGELSVIPSEIKLLTPCLHDIPEALRHQESRFRKRYLDLIVNKNVRNTFITRAKIINFLRQFLNSREFLEVETPTLATNVGGANALPFMTQSKALNTPLFMRIAPELYLKQLVIGGLERVYEIGKCYRNEGIDAFHNPEFTTIELYQAWADYYDLIKMTETMLHDLVVHITGSPKLTVKMRGKKWSSEEESGDEGDAENEGETVVIDFTPPFKQVNIVEEIEKHTGKLPEFGSPDCVSRLHQICLSHGVAAQEPFTYARLLDSLVGHFLESNAIQPTFLCNHPLALSPLAKSHRDNAALTERFELFIAGKEICNSYTELNDPREQRQRFKWQAEAKKEGDAEAQPPDEAFCEALEYGLPPTAGWGLGIDRLVMLLTQSPHIREVLLFPTMKEHKTLQTDKKETQ